jgi:PHD/YefM family antitoxin component YafN of YafNO toxin-antitoxin module
MRPLLSIHRNPTRRNNMTFFELGEVVAARDAARRFSSLMEQLRDGSARRFVVLFRNRPQAVVLHVSEYERLVEAAGERTPRAA